MARKLEEDVAFRVLAAGNFPSHRTLCEFRRRHLGDFKRLFVEVVRLAAETGVANFGKLSIDGTKVRASASKRKADEARGRKPGQKRNPKGGRAYKREHGEPDGKAQDNFTDPQSRIMKTSAEGFQPCYNARWRWRGRTS